MKGKAYRQLAYVLQAHESKIMIDINCRKILYELPGTFINISQLDRDDPDKAETVKAIMLRSQAVRLKPDDQIGSILIYCD